MAGLSVTAISELDSELVRQSQEEFTTLLQERYPELELRRGLIHDVVAFLSGGVAGAITQTEISRVLQSRSLLAIQENPALADPVLVDHVLSNVNISRKVGTSAGGEITIVVTGGETVVIPANAKYTAAGLVFRTDAAIIARPVGTVITAATDRVLTARGDGSYSFTVPATAETVGDEYNIRANTSMLPDPVPSRFVTAFANGDFSGGLATESNAELITRMNESVPAAVSGGRANLTALIKRQPVFADTLHYAFAGAGDAEMSRDQRSIFPVSIPGCVDIYARTAAYPQTVPVTVTCTLQQKLAASSVWAFSVPRTMAPGFYRVESIRDLADPADFSGYAVVSDIRGVDLSGSGWRPDIRSAREAVFTAWQTAHITFEDNATDVTEIAVGSTRDYVVSFLVSPLIRELQEFISDTAVRPLGADLLVRAAIPCLLTINATILRAEDESAPDLDVIRVALRNYVSGLNFPGTLYASQLMDVIHKHLASGTVVSSIVMQGSLLRTDGDVTVIRHTTALAIPNAPSVEVSPRIVAFFLDTENIGLTVQVRT
jgi:hypothetical protein